MATLPGGTTRTQFVYDELRSAILRGTPGPGAPLRLQELGDRFGVSMSVVREALTKLAERHLVTNEPNAGFRVVELSREDLVDLVDMRIQFEGLALVRSIERGDLDWAGSVVSAHYVLENTPLGPEGGAPGTSDEWSEAHERFHDALGAACGSRRLLSYTRLLRDGAELYRQLSGGGPDDRDVAGEHRRLMELATTRQPEAARLALSEHLQRTADGVLANVFAHAERSLN